MPEITPSEQPKTDAALEALDAAIEKVEAFADDNDETDAAAIWDRVHELERRLQGAPSHAPRDALTGVPVNPDGGANLGPADPLAGRTSDPVVTEEEAGQAPSEDRPNLTDESR